MPVPVIPLVTGGFGLDALTAKGLQVEAEVNASCGLGATRYVAPVAPPPVAQGMGTVVDLTNAPNLEVWPSYSAACRRSEFWRRGVFEWMGDLREAMKDASVVSVSAIGDPLRPAPYVALEMARMRKIPSVVIFAQDRQALAAAQGPADGSSGVRKAAAIMRVQQFLSRRAVRKSDASILRIGNAYDNLGPVARHAQAEIMTQFTKSEIMARDMALATSQEGRKLRLVYFGQLIRYKRVDDAIRWAAMNSDKVHLTIIGDGPDEGRLRSLASSLNAPVDFLAGLPYGQEFLGKISEFDVHFFPNSQEDTPRSILDGFARGLPLLSARTAYTEQLAKRGAPVTFLEDLGSEVGLVARDLPARRAAAVDFAATVSVERWAGDRADLYRSLVQGRAAR